MITRFVKLHLKPEYIDTFRELFTKVNQKIKAMKGCKNVVLLQDIQNPCIFFTHSEWESEDALNAYRNTPLFIETWAFVKPFFAEKAAAWSLNILPSETGKLIEI